MIALRWPKRATLGARGESLAARTLRREGYVVLDRNVRLGRYEIDIIAREGDTIAFVEVKSRHCSDVYAPENNITWKKKQHIAAAARHYLVKNAQPGMSYRFDVVAVVYPKQGRPQVTVHRDAFRAA